MLPFHDWLLLASICALGAMAPGISLAVVTRHTLHGGHRAGAIAGVTHALGIGIWAAATVTGMAILFHRYPVLEQLFSMAGALFLLWMAWKSWQAGRARPRTGRRAGLAPAQAGVPGSPPPLSLVPSCRGRRRARWSWPACSARRRCA